MSGFANIERRGENPVSAFPFFFFKLILKEKHSLSIYRLNHDKLGGAWCPKNTIQEGIREWIQIDLKQTHTITGIVTQVRNFLEKYSYKMWTTSTSFDVGTH